MCSFLNETTAIRIEELTIRQFQGTQTRSLSKKKKKNINQTDYATTIRMGAIRFCNNKMN